MNFEEYTKRLLELEVKPDVLNLCLRLKQQAFLNVTICDIERLKTMTNSEQWFTITSDAVKSGIIEIEPKDTYFKFKILDIKHYD